MMYNAQISCVWLLSMCSEVSIWIWTWYQYFHWMDYSVIRWFYQKRKLLIKQSNRNYH